MKRFFSAFIGITLIATSAQSADYVFTNIADEVNGSFNALFIPTISNNGTVAFRAIDGNSVDGIYSAPPAAVIADQGDDELFAAFADPSISNNGLVVFDVFAAGGLDNAIYSRAVGDNSPATLLYDTSDEFSCLFNPVINSSGLVAFRGETLSIGGDCDSFINIPAGIYLGSGPGDITLIADNSGFAPDDFFDVGFEPRINENGTVVFTAEYNSGEFGVFTGNGGALTTIIESDSIYGAFQWPSINCAGTVAFVAFTGAGGGFSIMKGDGTTPAATVIDTSSGLREFRLPSINCSGTIAFLARAENFGIDGLYTLSEGVISKVVEVGDSLAGLTIDQITFSNTGLNDNGQLVFRAKLSDNNDYIFVADEIEANAAHVPVIINFLLDDDSEEGEE
jgi:hypothetical protein